MAAIYRAPMRARRLEAPPGAGAEHGLERGLVGIGERLEEPPAGLDQAIDAAGRAHGPKAARMLERFAGLEQDTFVWTRAGDGSYWLGRIRGPWRYDDTAEAREVGIHHVRDARWLERPFGEDEVPDAVARTFARGGRNLQRIHDAEAERRTAALWSSSAPEAERT